MYLCACDVCSFKHYKTKLATWTVVSKSTLDLLMTKTVSLTRLRMNATRKVGDCLRAPAQPTVTYQCHCVAHALNKKITEQSVDV